MYQWVETRETKDKEEKVTYKLEWKSTLQNSIGFEEQ